MASWAAAGADRPAPLLAPRQSRPGLRCVLPQSPSSACKLAVAQAPITAGSPVSPRMDVPACVSRPSTEPVDKAVGSQWTDGLPRRNYSPY